MTRPVLVAAALLFSRAPAPTQWISLEGREDRALHETVKKGITYIYQEKFDAAVKLFEGIKNAHPRHPIGYFCMAAALDARMLYYFSGDKEAEFTANCDKAIEAGEEILKKSPNDKWVMFFVGGAYGYKGTFQARYKKFLTAFRNGWTGVLLLKQLYEQDSAFADVLLGLGTYNYWSSKFSRMLWWMPGLEDKREEGIRQLRKLLDGQRITSDPAASNLAPIFIAEERYGDAVELCERVLKSYPSHRYFTYKLAEALYLKGDHVKSEEVFLEIADRCDAEKFNNTIYPLMCRSYLARIYEKRGVSYKAAAECRRALAYRFNATDQVLADEFQGIVKEVLAKVEKHIPIR